MLVPGNLGLQSLLLLLGWVAFLVIRHKWRNALAKKEEIMRLVAMASEEAAVAEVEATVKLCVTPVDREFQCAVCYCPTTMRCSQCKNVRYCSGKCQIIHWRRGHKDECYNPKAMLLSEVQKFGQRAILQRQPETLGDDLVMERKSTTSSEAASISSEAASLMADGDDIDQSFADCKQSDTEFASSNISFSSGNTSVGSKIESIDVPSKKVLGSDTFDHSKKSLAGDNTLHRLVSRGSPVVLDGNSLRSKSTYLANPVDGIHRGNKQANRESSYAVEEFNFQGQPSNVKMATSNDVQVAMGKKKPTKEAASMESLDTKMSSSTHCVGPSCLRIDSASGTGANNSQLFNHKELRSLSHYSSREHQTLTGGNLVCSTKSQDGYHSLSTKCSGNASSICNVNHNLKMSVQRVVQQFKVSKPLKSSQHGLNSEPAGRYNCKLIFPYERFVELYYYDKLNLQPFGLANCGNSCYANSVLQCLAFTRPLTSYLLQGIHSKKCRKNEWCFICEFEYLVLKAKEGMSPISPMGILSKIHKIGSHLGHGRQEDAHEFLRYAVDAMQFVCLKEAGVKGSSAEETTLIGLTFGGHLLSKIKCLKCLSKSERCERMMDLTVEIGGDIRTLEEALAQFTASEILDQSNMYHCGRCKSYERAQKKLTILEAPNILTIVLKRFQSGNFEKLNKSIKFPEILNMAPYISGSNDDSPLYSLYGVVVHSDVMNATYSGHYVCYIQNFEGQWFKIDDSTVEPVALERVLSQGAYMLLYARHSPKAPSMMRSSIVPNGKAKERNLEAVPSSDCKSKSRYSVAPKIDASMALQKPGKFAYWPTSDGYANKQSDPDDWRSRPVHRVHAGDSSSESSSIFSFSDVSSCSTASTKDSVTTEDLSDYIFGEAGTSCYNHYGTPPNSVASTSCPSYDANLRWEGEGRTSRILYTDAGKHQRKLTTHFDSCNNGRSSSRSSDFDNFVYADPLISRTGSAFRTREESAQIYF